MTHYAIVYRLLSPNQDYEALYAAIRKISGTYLHNTTSSWIVASTLSAKTIFNLLKPHIAGNDEIGVFKLQGEYFGVLSQRDINWLAGEPGLFASTY